MKDKQVGLFLAGILVVLAAVLLSAQPVMSTEDLNPTTASVTVNVVVSSTLSNVPITFGSVADGATKEATSGAVLVTIETATNIGTNLSINGSANFISGGNTFAIGNLSYTNQTAGTYTNMTITYADGGYVDWQTIPDPVGSAETRNIYTNITIPSGQASGDYTADVSVRVQSE